MIISVSRAIEKELPLKLFIKMIQSFLPSFFDSSSSICCEDRHTARARSAKRIKDLLEDSDEESENEEEEVQKSVKPRRKRFCQRERSGVWDDEQQAWVQQDPKKEYLVYPVCSERQIWHKISIEKEIP